MSKIAHTDAFWRTARADLTEAGQRREDPRLKAKSHHARLARARCARRFLLLDAGKARDRLKIDQIAKCARAASLKHSVVRRQSCGVVHASAKSTILQRARLE